VTQTPPSAPAGSSAAFDVAAASLRAAELRRDLTVDEIPAPSAVAPHAIAFAGDVHPPDHGIDSQLGTGRFILLHDPEEPEPWEGDFRIVVYAQAPLERDIGSDPLLPEVAWSWLLSALDDLGAPRHAMSGTATTVLSTGFGGLAEQEANAHIELRASWTPDGLDLGVHLQAWGEFLCALAGLPPTTEGVALISARRTARDR
jgi:hypothetical protein